MSNVRLIARLDIKGPNLIKGIRLEGLRKLGNPNEFARRYYRQGVDEILYIDTVASLYDRANILEIVRKTCDEVFIPITVGGGVRSIDDARILLRAGADKIAVNTAAVKNPELVTELSRTFGSQCVVLSIQAKRASSGGWEAYTDNGREHSGVDAVEWAFRGVELGAGELLLTSVDQDGTRKGFDLDLVRKIAPAVKVPVIACGGMGSIEDLLEVVECGADAVAMGSVLHYNNLEIGQLRSAAAAAGIRVRQL